MARKNIWENIRRKAYLDDALAANIAAGPSSTTETTILASQVVRLNNDIHVGLNLLVDVYGVLTSDSGGNDLDFALRYGSTDIIQVECNNLSANASIIPWHFHAGVRIHTRGSSGKVVGAGWLVVGQATALLNSSATAAAGESITLSTESTFNLTMQWGTSHASNVCTALAGALRIQEGV